MKPKPVGSIIFKSYEFTRRQSIISAGHKQIDSFKSMERSVLNDGEKGLQYIERSLTVNNESRIKESRVTNNLSCTLPSFIDKLLPNQ